MAKRVADNFRLTRQKLEIAGLGEALGAGTARTTARFAGFWRFQGRRGASTAPGHRIQLCARFATSRKGPVLRDINVYVDELMASLSETWQLPVA